jgi:hypothetical protein
MGNVDLKTINKPNKWGVRDGTSLRRRVKGG